MPAAKQYEGRVFQLSQSYPTKEPDSKVAPDIATRNFEEVKKNWRKYLLDVRDYCFEGNIGNSDVEDDWRLEQGHRWFHMPWQHYGPNGREGIHGLTKEAPVQMRQLAWSQTYSGGQTYAVACYNDFGGYTIGQVWKDHEHPAADMKKIEFPVGTVVSKVLFVDIPPDQVPYLNPPLQWHCYVTDNYLSTNRSIRPLSLIQMDVMIRHKDAPSGWIFGTFQYNGQRKNRNPGETPWHNLVPLGLQWGNDPIVRANASNPQPVSTIVNDSIKESAINRDADELPATHLGWNGRLNGPVDNSMSSCMSCHMAAETPQRSQISPLFESKPPEPGSDAWMRWFQNLRCGERFDAKSLPTDFSLQMAIGLQNFRAWRNEGSKVLASRYQTSKVPAKIIDLKPPQPNMREMHDDSDEKEVEIRRDYPLRNP
jgi:hypothetical protein